MAEEQKDALGQRLDQIRSSFPTAYHSDTRLPTGLSGQQLEEALASGAVTFKSDASVPVVNPDGTAGHVPAANLRGALAAGFRLDTPDQIAARQLAKEHPIASTVLAGAEGVSDALLGAPDYIAKALSPSANESAQQAFQQKSEEEHPVVGGAARVASEALLLGTGLGEVGGIAKAAEAAVLAPKAIQAGSKALAKVGLDVLADEAPSLLRQVAASAAKTGVEGAIVNSPLAAKQVIQGDPEKAAETLLWGAGTGALFGGFGKLAGKALSSEAASVGERYAASRLEQLSGDGASEAWGHLAGGLASKAVKTAALGLGLGGHGLAGLGAYEGARTAGKLVADSSAKWLESEGGQVAKSWLTGLAKAPLENGFGTGWAQQGVSMLEQKLATVPAMLSAIATSESERATQPRTKISIEQAGKVAAMAQQLASQPNLLLDVTSQLAAPLNHDESSQMVSLQLQGKLMNTVNYIADNAPKPARPPGPFEKDNWQPGPLQLASLARKLEVVNDPFSVLKRIADNTLTQDHVQALNALYPKIAEEIRKAVVATASQPNAPKLTAAARQKLGMLMGTPLDALSTPEATRTLQSGFMPQPQAGGPPPGAGPAAPKQGPGRPPKLTYDKLPSTFTDAQNLQFNGSRRGSR